MILETGQPLNQTDTAHSYVMDVDERSFQTAVMERSQDVPVVIDFWAPWCAPCRQLGPTLERLAAEAQGAWVLAKINTDQNQRLAQMFRVQGIPAVMAVYQGKVVEQFTGALPESQVRAWLKRFVPEQGGSLIDAARELEPHDPEAAISRYRLLLGEQPDHSEALFRLGRLLLLQGEAEGPATLRQIPGDSPFFGRAQAALPLAEFLAAADADANGESATHFQQAARAARAANYEAAMQTLLTLVARDRAFRDDGARKALLALFAVLGDDHPLVPGYRRRLASTLF
ncbi:tetratricopeptide repeat protein [Candidatus Viridilinea mediisalina]|uniref:Co-chaperone YbbN n=1 Tax=Candidatus Viridilinea mediisalina TaxID=2024553 RepID=A0A2A6RFE4_9CHLR|nr:tetratricopeptide repeat protein [Candidatus Viridilinea mediisalina]PDW01742.1 co-chaperone YbbN [Candidatus Viridilinea mediisalina]